MKQVMMDAKKAREKCDSLRNKLMSAQQDAKEKGKALKTYCDDWIKGRETECPMCEEEGRPEAVDTMSGSQNFTVVYTCENCRDFKFASSSIVQKP